MSEPTTDVSSDMVRPGDWLLIAVQMPTELEDSETCHMDLLAEDFMRSRGSHWNVEVRGIDRRTNDRTA